MRPMVTEILKRCNKNSTPFRGAPEGLGWVSQPGTSGPQLWRPCRVGERYLQGYVLAPRSEGFPWAAFQWEVPLKESNFHNTSSGKLPRKQNLRHKNIQDHRLGWFSDISGKFLFVMWNMGKDCQTVSLVCFTKMNKMARKQNFNPYEP